MYLSKTQLLQTLNCMEGFPICVADFYVAPNRLQSKFVSTMQFSTEKPPFPLAFPLDQISSLGSWHQIGSQLPVRDPALAKHLQIPFDNNHEDSEGVQQHCLHRRECEEEELGEGGEGEQEEGQLLQGRGESERKFGQKWEPSREFDPWIRICGNLARKEEEKPQVCGRSHF